MRRRHLLALAGALPVAARAQQTKPTVGFIGPTNETAGRSNFNIFVRRLGELGWADGRNLTVDLRWADGREDRAAAIAQEFARAKIDLIVTGSDAFVLAAMRAAPRTPIVTVASSDPVATGQVASLARPGGNITGLTMVNIDTAGKRLELLKELVPGLRRVGVMGDFSNQLTRLEASAVEAASRQQAAETAKIDVRVVADFAGAIEQFKSDVQAVYAVSQPLITANAAYLNGLALAAHLPTLHGFRENAVGGGLISYAADLSDSYRRAAEFVDKILRGAKPADLPVEQPTKFTLVLNLKTAKALGITVSPLMLARADEVIE